MNDMRHHLYKKKFEVKNKVINLYLLPPCFDSLQLHIVRSGFITRRYGLSKERNINEPVKTKHGWDENDPLLK